MAKYDLRLKAYAMRRSGDSVNTIAKALGISKSTSSFWCKDITLSLSQRALIRENSILAGHRGRLLGAETNRLKKKKALEQASEYSRKMIGQSLSDRELLIAGAALYWSEGSKTDSTSGFLFVNSDPRMIVFMKVFLERVFNVSADEITCTIQVNAIHAPRINKILRYWSRLLNLPPECFNRPYYVHINPSKVYENYDNYYGTVRLRVRKSGVLKYRVLALINEMESCLSR